MTSLEDVNGSVTSSGHHEMTSVKDDVDVPINYLAQDERLKQFGELQAAEYLDKAFVPICAGQS